ncbi:MAG: FecR domain-containing protein, partial [Spirochaetes bacterium]|nr:FecR domain-containing protein [Spirochaetota bacterium]
MIQLDGTVQIQKGEGASYARAYLGSDLLPEYLIKTGPESRAKVQIGERAVISIEANSIVRIRDLNRDQTTGQENTRVEFKGGKSMVNITKKLAAQDSFDVMTPSAVAGVRGTEFLVDTENPEASKIAVTKGSVAVRKRIAALDDAPAKSDTPVAVREALRELAANQEVAVRVNQEVAVTQKESDAVSAIVADVVQTATVEMKKASEDKSAPVEAKREAIERQLTAIISESQKKIEARPEAKEVVVAPISDETKKKVEAIEVVAPVPVETLERLPEKKNESARDIRDVMKEKAAPAEPEK